jgi:hypothetical protein
MRLPPPLVEHPIESVIASLLLVALLFVSAGQAPAADSRAPQAAAEKM